jgi:DNA polymerase-1
MSLFAKQRTEVVPKVNLDVNYKFIYTQSQFDKYYDNIMKLPYWVLDTETTGTDSHVDRTILMQIGNKYEQYLIDTREVKVDRLKDRMEDESLKKIAQNAIFDYKMILGSHNLYVEGWRDTMLAEMLLTCGIQKFGFSMEDLALKYLNVQLDKRMQKSFINHHGAFTQQQLVYAALDCVVPDYILEEQFKLLERENLIKAWKIECNAVPAFGDIEYRGLLLDTEAWMQNISTEQKLIEEATADFLDEAAKYVGTDLLGHPDINPGSSAQVLKLFQEVYGKKVVVDSDGKAGTGDEVLQKLCEKFDDPKLVTSLQRIREHSKKVSTYGMSYVNAIHEKTGRLHPRIGQIGTETGRPNGKKPNMLNIPALPQYRHPWIAGPGRKMLTNDYGACELRIMASMSGDPVMCKGFNDGLDYHTFTASQFITDDEPYLREFIAGSEPGKGKLGNYILDDNGDKQPNPNYGQLVPYDKVLKSQRTVAKTINFGLAYGMGAGKLSRTLKINMDKAREYVKQFNETFAVLVAWLKENQVLATQLRSCSYQELQRAENEGREPRPDLAYSETALGRRRYFVLPKAPVPVQLADQYVRYDTGSTKEIPNRWFDPEKPAGRDNRKMRTVPVYVWKGAGLPDLNYDPKNPWDDNMPKKVKKYYQRLAGIQREGGNSPIQGGNADITKIAMYELRKWIRSVEKERNNGEYLAHVALQVYDELMMDCPEWLAEEAAQKMDELMQKAGDYVIDKVPVETGCIIENSWVKG